MGKDTNPVGIAPVSASPAPAVVRTNMEPTLTASEFAAVASERTLARSMALLHRHERQTRTVWEQRLREFAHREGSR